MPQNRYGTLAAGVVTTVTLTQDWNTVEVINRSGTAEIFFRTDGTNPTVGGNDSEMLPAAVGSVVVDVESGAATVVKLISAGTPTYGVRGGR